MSSSVNRRSSEGSGIAPSLSSRGRPGAIRPTQTVAAGRASREHERIHDLAAGLEELVERKTARIIREVDDDDPILGIEDGPPQRLLGNDRPVVSADTAPLKISGTAGTPSLKKHVRFHSGSISISSCMPSNPPTVTGVGSLTTRPGAVSSHATRSPHRPTDTGLRGLLTVPRRDRRVVQEVDPVGDVHTFDLSLTGNEPETSPA